MEPSGVDGPRQPLLVDLERREAELQSLRATTTQTLEAQVHLYRHRMQL